MAARVLAAGHELCVYNRTPARADALVAAGAKRGRTPREAASGAVFVISMVTDAAAADAMYRGEHGALSGATDGAVAIEMSTIGPAAARLLATAAAAKGVVFIDAPVSGSTAMAQSGQLTTMVGGPVAEFERARPVLAAMTRLQLHLGEVGAGATMKLALNTIIALTNQAIAECLVLAGAAGIDASTAYDVLEHSAVASPFVGYKRAAFLAPQVAAAAFSTDLMRKDLSLAMALASELGVAMPATSATAAALAAASASGYGESDISAVALTLRPSHE